MVDVKLVVDYSLRVSPAKFKTSQGLLVDSSPIFNYAEINLFVFAIKVKQVAVCLRFFQKNPSRLTEFYHDEYYDGRLTMRRRTVIKSIAAISALMGIKSAQSQVRNKQDLSKELIFRNDKIDKWIVKAEILKPSLHHETVKNKGVVEFKKNKNGQFEPKHISDNSTVKNIVLQAGDGFILDFGNHFTGFINLDIGWLGRSADAPVRMRLIYGQVPEDVCEPLYPYNGWVSASWLPDEIINVDFLPNKYISTRRHAFRYLKIEVISTSRDFNVNILDATIDSVTSAGKDLNKPEYYQDKMMQRIDEVAIRTLSQCMQTTFEDGPRRDQRLWLGDLHLQAKVNYLSFKNTDLVKRCLFLFAGLRNTDGIISACVYEKPEPRIGQDYFLDYSLFFCSILYDYYVFSKDDSTLNELYIVAKRQLNYASGFVDSSGVFYISSDVPCFIDWNDKLDKQASMQGVMIYVIKRMINIADALQDEENSIKWKLLLDRMISATQTIFWDEHQGVFISGKERQISWASQAWLGLAGTIPASKAVNAILKVIRDDSTITATTPYLYHTILESLVFNDASGDAVQLLKKYWGGMVNLGADTFWESFNPDDPHFSPYGGRQINSYCHAWSCTPSFFIRTNFQKANNLYL